MTKDFLFNKENEKKCQDVLKKYPSERKRSAILPLLDLAQRQNGGYLSQAVIEYIAMKLDLASIRVYEVASFYTMFNLQPIGEYHIQICGTTPCWLRGAGDIVETCKKRLGINCGETTEDKKFTLSEVECLGACINAPVVQINDDYYEDLTPKKMDNILDQLSKVCDQKMVKRKPKSGGN